MGRSLLAGDGYALNRLQAGSSLPTDLSHLDRALSCVSPLPRPRITRLTGRSPHRPHAGARRPPGAQGRAFPAPPRWIRRDGCGAALVAVTSQPPADFRIGFTPSPSPGLSLPAGSCLGR
jgi:hypothetical protein